MSLSFFSTRLQLIKIVSIIILLFCIGCGPKVFLAPESNLHLRTLVLLPQTYEANVAREKIDYVHDAFARKLSARGFKVISGQALDALCPKQNCGDLNRLASQTDSDAVAQISVTGTNSANVLAGYYNSISGSGKFLDRTGKEIAKVDYTQSEKGGLLFNSGQVLQGLQSTVDSFGDASFARLADKFLETLVSKLPAPVGTQEVKDLQIGKSSLTPLGQGRYLACVESSNAQNVSIRGGKSIFPLRPSGAGKFCGGFLFDLADNAVNEKSPWLVNLAGRFGETKNIPFDHLPRQNCTTDNALKREDKKITLSAGKNGCDMLNFLVFEAKQSAGPFSLKGKLQKPGSAISLGNQDSSVVAVVGVSEKLGSSRALLFK